jgi:hypothetical protein
MKKIIVFCAFIITCWQASAQDSLKITRDTIYIENQDTTLIKSYAKRYNPRKSLLLAAIAPGAGQIYNKKYWKLPLVYGGFYLIGTGINYYNDFYKEYKAHLFYNLEHYGASESSINPATNLPTTTLRRIVDRAQRERDFMIILMAGMYLLQIIDAHVDTHLKEFDLNPNLKKARLQATIKQDAVLGRQTGISLIYRF